MQQRLLQLTVFAFLVFVQNRLDAVMRAIVEIPTGLLRDFPRLVRKISHPEESIKIFAPEKNFRFALIS